MRIYKNLSLPLTVASSLSWGRKFCNFFTLFISYWQKVFTIVSYCKWCVVISSSSSNIQLKLWKVTEQNGNKESLFLFLPILSYNQLFSLLNRTAHFRSWTRGMCCCQTKECLVTFNEKSVSFYCCWNYSFTKFFIELDVETLFLFSLLYFSLPLSFCLFVFKQNPNIKMPFSKLYPGVFIHSLFLNLRQIPLRGDQRDRGSLLLW